MSGRRNAHKPKVSMLSPASRTVARTKSVDAVMAVAPVVAVGCGGGTATAAR
jgi:hypothetical protein